MAEPVMNELLQEATSGCDELGDEMTTTMEIVERATGRAEKLQSLVDQEGAEAHGRFESLEDRLEASAGALETAAEEAKGGLERLAARAAEVQGEVAEMLEGVKSGLDDLETRREEVARAMEAAGEDVNAAADALQQRVAEVQSRVSAHLAAAGERLAAFGGAVEDAQEEFQSHAQAFEEAVLGVARLAVRESRAQVEAIDQALAEQGDAIDALTDDLVEAHNGAMGVVGPRFTEEAVQALGESLDPLQAAIEALTELCTDETQGLAEKAAAVRQQADVVVGLMEAVVPVLTAAGQLG
jgi:chromosome segregation ATPase